MRSCERWLALMTVRTRAMDLRMSWLWARDGLVLFAPLLALHHPLGEWWEDCAYILVSFDEAPPAIFAVRSCTSSAFRSSSCLVKSSLFLPQSWEAFTLAVDCDLSSY